MHNLLRLPISLLLLLLALCPAMPAEEPVLEPKERILFVPFEDLPVILGGPNERVFMTREQYQQLVAEAAKKPAGKAPQSVVLLHAEYAAEIGDSVATLRGQLDVEVLDRGVHLLPLPLQGVALLSAQLDAQPAPIGKDAQGQVVLFVRDEGRHRLELELQCPVVVAAAQQSLQLRVPHAGSTRVNVRVPGNVEVKSGAHVLQRQYDSDADRTEFSVLPESGALALVMSLNNRRLRDERVVTARSVVVSELTASYERLHVTAHMQVLHGAVERFLFDVPSGFQVTSVTSPRLAQWLLRQEGEQDVLEIVLREAIRDTESLNIAASRVGVNLDQWTMPHLQPRDVAGNAAVVGLIAESRLRPLSLESEDLVAIDTNVLRQALPASVFEAEPGAPPIRPIAAYYAPSGSYTFSAALEDPQDELRAAINLLLVVDEAELVLRGSFTLTPQASMLTRFAFQLPAEWQLSRLHLADQQPLPRDRYPADAQTRYVVLLPTTLQPGSSQTVYFEASYRSASWLTSWNTQTIEFPRVVLEGVTDSSGAVAVQAAGDLIATPVQTPGLIPLDAQDRSRFGLTESTAELTYEIADEQYTAQFLIERKQPRITSRNYSFFQVRDGVITSHHEVVYLIQRAHARQLALAFPASVPTAISIRGLDGVEVKQYSHVRQEDGSHHWTVLLARPSQDTVRLAVDYEQPLSEPPPEELVLPLVRSLGVAHQTRMIAVEGDPALDITVRTEMRRVDVGELVDADYTPGARLLGSFASTADDQDVRLSIARRQLRPLPAALVKRAELVTLVATSGISQSSARYQLQTKVPFLALTLPPDSTLWSTTLNGVLVRPRKRGEQVLLSLQTEGAAEECDLRVVYQTPVQQVRTLGAVRSVAPELRLLEDDQDAGSVVPQVDLVWHVYLPTGYRVSRVRGTVFTSEVSSTPSPLKTLAEAAFLAGGGAPGPMTILNAQRAARELATVQVDDARYRLAEAEALAARARFAVPGQPTGQIAGEPMAQTAPMDEYAGGREMPQSSMGGYPGAGMPGMGAPPPGMMGGGGFGSGGMMGAVAGDASGDDSRRAGGMGMGSGMGPGSGPLMGMGSGSGMTPGMGGMEGMGDMAGMGMGGSVSPRAPMGGAQGPQSGEMPPSQVPPAANANGLVPQASTPLAAGQVTVDTGTIVVPPPVVNGPGTDTAQTRQAAQGIDKLWALQGLSGVVIELDQTGESVTFLSLGNEPELDITVVHQGRMEWFAVAVGLVLLVVGLLLARRPLGTRLLFLVVTILIASGLPILGGPTQELAPVFRGALLAAFVLIPLWVLVALVTRVGGWIARRGRLVSSAVSLLVALALCGSGSLVPQAEAQELRDLLKPLLDEPPPVRIPDDAVVIPYDPADEQGQNRATKVLVPYQRYVELWNQAYPDQKIEAETLPAEFSLAGVRYTAAISDAEQLVLTGSLDIELFGDTPVDVPLALQDGVITKALLDGQPARLKTIAADFAANQQAAEQQAVAAPTSLVAVLVEGQGRHQLELTIQIAIARQGGWRAARATLPHAEASTVELSVPDAETSLRRPLGDTMLSHTTQAAGETYRCSLQPGGLLDVSWRARISPGTVDQALTADSAALIDVREDGVRVAWHVALSFGQSERSTFRFEVPADYLVEKLDGSNVRGWDTQQDGQRTIVTVELLKAVKQREEMVLHMSHRGLQPSASDTAFSAPMVAVPDAALQRGVVQIRRSPILELQAGETSGVSRADGSAVTQQLDTLLGELQSPLGVVDFQAYRFHTTPYRIDLTATQITPRLSARLRTIFRIGETESRLESEILVTPRRRAIYEVTVAIPAELELEQVSAPGLTDWSLNAEGDQRLLRAFFSSGVSTAFPLAIHGQLGDHTPDQAVALPQLSLLGADEQEGHVVVQVDPSLDAQATELVGCENVLLERVVGWLNEQQRPLARIALYCPGANYAGQIRLSPRQPRVTCDTITNVRVTYREIEETILLDFNIVEAGVRQVRFRLPMGMADAAILAPYIRQKSVTPIDGEEYVQVQLDLQDAITGEYRVVIEHDRAITPDSQLAPLPVIDTGTTNHRYVTLENEGRDEVVIEQTPGMEAVTRQSRQWDQLARRLPGGDFSTAYVAAETGTGPQFGYKTQRHDVVVTAGASIGLARTHIVLDASGAYRASITLKVDNRIEPYLEIRLPADAQLWTAHVAGQPVKPARSLETQDANQLRIPLIKTAEGDLDYEVVLKYAGRLPQLHSFRLVDFPMIHTENISVELSQVQLHVPEDYRWHQFDGTATQVASQEDLEAGFIAYQTQQVERLTQIIRGSNQFSQSRAMYNVEKLGKEMQFWAGRAGSSRGGATHEQLRMNLESNTRVLEEAAQEIAEVEAQQAPSYDNRDVLHTWYEEQRNEWARNSVTRLQSNFGMPAPAPTDSPQPADATKFNDQWLFESRSAATPTAEPPAAEPQAADEAAPQKKGKARVEQVESYRVQQQMQPETPEAQDAAQKVFQGDFADQKPLEGAQPATPPARGETAATKSELNRAYMDRIQRQDRDSEVLEGETARGRLPMLGVTADGASNAALEGREADAAESLGRVGLASLDFPLPERGQVYYFTTPRGDVQITARPVKRDMGDRLLHFLSLSAITLGLVVAVAVARRARHSRVLWALFVVALGGGGLVILVLGVLPIFALAMMLGSLLLAFDSRLRGE